MGFALLFAATVIVASSASVRVAARWVGTGWASALTAAALLAALAAFVPVVAGLTGLGTSPWLLAVLTWVIAGPAAYAAGPVHRRLSDEARLALRRGGTRVAATVGAAAGLAGAYLVYSLTLPTVRTDPFHLVESVRWLHGGRPASVEHVVEWPAGAYPLVNELIVTWGIGLARGFAPAALWTVTVVVLLACAVYLGLRERAGRGASAFGASAVVLLAATVGTLEGTGTDLPSLAWLAVAVALVASPDASRCHPGPATLALGLAVGTKTNVALLGALLVLPAVWRHRGDLGPAGWGAVGAGAAIAVAAPLRNLILHGSPLWPFTSLGFGDPIPYLIRDFQTTFLDAPAHTLRALASDQPWILARVAVPLTAAVAVAVLARDRVVGRVGLVTAVAFAAWANGPFSGAVRIDGVDVAFPHYALPVVCAAAVTAALALRAGVRRSAQIVAAAALAATCLLCITGVTSYRVFGSLRDPFWVLLAGSSAGAAIGVALRFSRPRASALARWLAAPALVLAVVAGNPRYERPGVFGREFAAALEWLYQQPRYREGDDPVVTTWRPDARYAGTALRHDVILLPHTATCADVRRRVRDAWLVVPTERGMYPGARPAPGEECLRDLRPLHADPFIRIYSALAATP